MLSKTADGYRLAVHASPGARRTVVGGTHDSALRVAVTAPADQGKANRAIRWALADALGMKRSQIEIVGGVSHRRKLFALRDPPESLEEMVARLAAE